MLAIARALLQDPQLLVLDEPTAALAPVVVRQVEEFLATLSAAGAVAILLIEQNIEVATAIAGHVALMVNGRQLGLASCCDRLFLYVSISLIAVSFKSKNN